MAVNAVNSNQALNAPTEGAARQAPQAPPREAPQPRGEDRVNLSAEAQQKVRAETAHVEEARRIQEAQQQAVVQAGQEAAQVRATQDRPRVDFTA